MASAAPRSPSIQLLNAGIGSPTASALVEASLPGVGSELVAETVAVFVSVPELTAAVPVIVIGFAAPPASDAIVQVTVPAA